MSGIQKSSVLNNEPTLSASDFDKQLLKFVKDYCSPFEKMRQGLADVRIAATVEKDTKGKDIPLWPFDSCYVHMQYLMHLYQLTYIDSKLPQDQYQLKYEPSIIDLIDKPTILGGCFAWDKVRNIIHVNNKQFDNSLLDCPCASLAKLPQWAICFNTLKNDIFWNDRPVAGVIFYRYFLIKQYPMYTYNKGLDGVHKAYRNKVNTIIIYHDGTLDIGPFLDLYYSGSVKSYFNDTEKLLEDECNKTVKDFDYVEYTAARQANNSRAIFALLAYFVENLDKLKNEKGEKVSFAPNPEPVKTKKGYRLFGSDRISSYYLD